MRKIPAVIAAAAFAAAMTTTARVAAAPLAAQILNANEAATAGSAWNGKSALRASYSYAGQGLTGKTETLADLGTGRFVTNYRIGPIGGTSGFDGTKAWTKDPNGTVTVQSGGDQHQLAVNAAYRDANLWWRADRGGAEIEALGTIGADAEDYDVLRVTPKDGKAFEAWFDAKTNLLARVIEIQGAQTVTRTFYGYTRIDGVAIAGEALVSTGDKMYDQKMTLLGADFLGPQPVSAFAAPKANIADFAIAGKAESTSFPFVLIDDHIFADVDVNGKGPFRFIFDTGGVNLLSPPLAAELGIQAEGKLEGTGAGSGHLDVGLAKIASLELGKANISDQVFGVMPLETIANIEGTALPGMIGFETFRRFVTRIDYGRRTITLIEPEAFEPGGAGTAVPIAFDGKTIEAEAVYDGLNGNFTIDTGNRASLSLNAPFTKTNGLRQKAGRGVEAVVGWGVGGPTRAFVSRGGVLNFGGYSIDGPVVEMSIDTSGAFSADTQAGNIGAGVLKRFIVTLDYGHSTMYLKPVATRVTDLDTYDRSGMWINESADGFKVVAVTKTGPADKAGLRQDDTITAVDGRPASAIELYDLRRRLRDDAPGTVVDFTVSRDGKTKDVQLTLQDQI